MAREELPRDRYERKRGWQQGGRRRLASRAWDSGQPCLALPQGTPSLEPTLVSDKSPPSRTAPAEGPFPRWAGESPPVSPDLQICDATLPRNRPSIKVLCIKDSSVGSRHKLPGFKLPLHHLIAVESWASYLTSLCFHSLHSQMGISNTASQGHRSQR